MKKICLIIFIVSLFHCFIVRPAYAADAHLEFNPFQTTITSVGTPIEVNIDTGGQAVKSAKAVINFDTTLLKVSSVAAGDFFDDVSHNIYNSSGQVIINANLSTGSMLESKTGTGLLATMTVEALVDSGTAVMTFDCTEGSSTDSNINDPTPLDIIVCSANVDGEYSLGESPTPSASPLLEDGDDDYNGTGGTSAPIPVTAVSWPTIALLLSGLFLILAPVFL